MNKKALALVLAVLTMVSLLTACTNNNTNETTTATTTASAEEDILSIDNQIKILAGYEDTFKHMNFDTSGTPQAFKYAVTDLDNDGVLDVIVSACLGSGLYTESSFFEVHEKGRGINSCNPAQINRDSEPDLIVDSTDCYIHPETGERFFIYTDTIRATSIEIYMTKGWYTFRDNRLVYEPIVSQTISGDTITYKSSTDDEVITKEDFNSAVESYFEGYTKCTATFGWTNFVDENGVEATDLSEEDLAKAITESYAKFSVK